MNNLHLIHQKLLTSRNLSLDRKESAAMSLNSGLSLNFPTSMAVHNPAMLQSRDGAAMVNNLGGSVGQ